VASDGKAVAEHKGMGLVPDVFTEDHLDKLKGNLAIGHVRYSTTGSSLLSNAQPFTVHHGGRTISVGHNGNLINAHTLRERLENEGSIFQASSDTEIIVHLIAKNLWLGFEEAVAKALGMVKGAYSLIMMTEDTLIAARDPKGFRPLCLGTLNGGWVVASETCALDLIEAEYVRDVEPGEILFINEQGVKSVKPWAPTRSAFCIFEYIYFARPDSNIYGHNVYAIRKRQGAALAQEHPLEVDVVMPFPDSGNYAALGYCQARGIPLDLGMIRNHYVGRTFIQPSQSMRDFGVRVKLNPVRALLKDKRVLVIEDSIIRGTTARTRIKAIRDVGAKEVHMLVSCPPHRYPCFYGIDFSSKGELIACENTVEAIRDFIGLDSLGYLSLEGLISSTKVEREWFCLACFDGDYLEGPIENFSKTCME
jgi:amidophosphoribosyltransferase